MAEVKRRSVLRPRFTLWAMLVVITVFAIPLGYVAQRRSWNLRRKAAIKELGGGEKFILTLSATTYADLGIDNPVSGDPFEPIPAPSQWSFAYWWDELCQNRLTDNLLEVRSQSGSTEEVEHPRDPITDDDLVRLRDFPEIQSVHFFNEKQITDAGLEVLVRSRQLTHLQLHDLPRCTGRFARALSNHSNLKVICFSQLEQLNGDELEVISNLPRLEALLLDQCPGVEDATLTKVEAPAGLKYLRIVSDHVGDQTLSRWLARTNLEYLDIECVATRAIAPELARQTNLRSLRIANAPFQDADFEFFAKCENLKSLCLCEMPIHGKFLATLPRPDLLSRLDLSATLMSDECLRSIPRFKGLMQLDLNWTPINGTGLDEESNWPKSMLVSLWGTEFSEEGKNALAKLRGPDRIATPMNWTLGDYSRFPNTHPNFAMQIGGCDKDACYEIPYYSPSGNLQLGWTREWNRSIRVSNSPRDLMAPVIRLLELSKAKEVSP